MSLTTRVLSFRIIDMKHFDTKEQYIEKLTELTGISRATIFRFLSGNGVKESTKQKLNEAIKELGLNEDSREFEIIVSINSKDFDIFKGNSEALGAILEEASTKNIPVRLARDVSPKVKDGVGVIVLGKHAEELLAECNYLKRAKVPFVVINRMIKDSDISYVSAENSKAAYDIMQHLIEKGVKRVAFWGEQRTMVSQDKLLGVKKALEDANLPLSESHFFLDPDSVSLSDAIDSLISLEKLPDAFFAMDDETALLAIRTFLTRGIRVPEDILVSGMNDLDSSKNVVPSITSVHIDFKKFGLMAVNILEKLNNDKDITSIKTIVKHNLVIRDSTGGK